MTSDHVWSVIRGMPSCRASCCSIFSLENCYENESVKLRYNRNQIDCCQKSRSSNCSDLENLVLSYVLLQKYTSLPEIASSALLTTLLSQMPLKF